METTRRTQRSTSQIQNGSNNAGYYLINLNLLEISIVFWIKGKISIPDYLVRKDISRSGEYTYCRMPRYMICKHSTIWVGINIGLYNEL